MVPKLTFYKHSNFNTKQQRSNKHEYLLSQQLLRQLNKYYHTLFPYTLYLLASFTHLTNKKHHVLSLRYSLFPKALGRLPYLSIPNLLSLFRAYPFTRMPPIYHKNEIYIFKFSEEDNLFSKTGV